MGNMAAMIGSRKRLFLISAPMAFLFPQSQAAWLFGDSDDKVIINARLRHGDNVITEESFTKKELLDLDLGKVKIDESLRGLKRKNEYVSIATRVRAYVDTIRTSYTEEEVLPLMKADGIWDYDEDYMKKKDIVLHRSSSYLSYVRPTLLTILAIAGS